ncbi:Protein of unknown function [Bacillus wiedmannii]|uniref:Uncharacterized protein n=1 Tax=Bacillus wiedmannii TaxID=1890302 RepID=A0AB37YU23_9BACI|nr:Protein of unknown function [Bacillus wiedmannii]
MHKKRPPVAAGGPFKR